MKCSVRVDELRLGLRNVERAVGKTASLPILSSIYFSVHDGYIVLRATNLDVGIETRINGKTDKVGEVVVPANVLITLISTLPSTHEVHLSTQGQDLLIDTQNQKTRLKGFIVSEYPTFPVIIKEYSGSVSGNSLLQSFSRVILAAATYTMRQELMSVSFSFGKKVTLAATDSFRLTEESIDGMNVSGSTTVLIPLHSIQDCITLLSHGTPESVGITIGEGSIEFTIGKTQILSRLLEGKFPAYAEILPKQTYTTIRVDSELLRDALKQAKVFTSKLSDIHLTTHENEGLQVEAKSPDIGEYSNIIQATIEGSPISLVLNWKYISDAITGRDGEVIFSCASAQDPVKITSQNVNGFHIIMPMRGVV